jgi:hypothetical protein
VAADDVELELEVEMEAEVFDAVVAGVIVVVPVIFG